MVNLSYSTNCLNISKVYSDKHEIENRDYAVRLYHGWLILPVCAVALPLTLLFIAASVRAIRAHRVSRKFHALLVNRAVGDLAACLVSLVICAYIFAAEHVSTHWIQLLNTFFTACFWSGMVTYASIGFLKLYGIAEPLRYKNQVTMKKCLLLIKLSWVFFLLIVAATMGFTLIVKIQVLADWSGCKVETCLTWMYKVRNALTIFFYLATLICYVISVLLIRKAKRRSKRLHATSTSRQQRSVRKRFRFPLIKLTLGVATFAFFHLPYAVWNVALMFADGCFFVRHYNLMQSLLGLIKLFVLIRVLLDNVIGFGMDQEIRRQLFLLLGFRRDSVGEADRKDMKLSTTTTSSGVLSSESAPETFDTVVEEAKAKEAGSQRRTESAKNANSSSSNNKNGDSGGGDENNKQLRPKRFSDRTEYKEKQVRF